MELSISNVVLEALEEVGLANAIAEGRKNEFVSEDEIFSLLDNPRIGGYDYKRTTLNRSIIYGN